ncbi:hypothetical protein C8Q76DRAFT_78548 [Earliella scabrosa]|nr:hypothetical protein C8Q76DRAFT_78548 [Earliella scabrosa]
MHGMMARGSVIPTAFLLPPTRTVDQHSISSHWHIRVEHRTESCICISRYVVILLSRTAREIARITCTVYPHRAMRSCSHHEEGTAPTDIW